VVDIGFCHLLRGCRATVSHYGGVVIETHGINGYGRCRLPPSRFIRLEIFQRKNRQFVALILYVGK
ncbi:MAG: hypothetical protein K2L34_16075, partial [Muribaculaceae bacterium]|nr:hypothetical protein [Muribaculaceae bacterium]